MIVPISAYYYSELREAICFIENVILDLENAFMFYII
jgi:hypothetical protein